MIWTDAQTALLREGWASGMKPQAIAERIGRNLNAVLHKAKRLGLHSRRPKGRQLIESTCQQCGLIVFRRNPVKYCSVKCASRGASAFYLANRRCCPVCNTKVKPHSSAIYCSRVCSNLMMSRAVSKHDAATKARIHQMWEQDMSCTEIGLSVGLSKNAVIGLAHRMGLPSRKSQAAHTPRSRLTRAIAGDSGPWPTHAKTLPKRPAFDVLLFGIEASRKPPAKREPQSLPPAPTTSPHRTCQYPTSDSKPYTFCGDAVYPGRSYCEAHCRICYSPWPPTRRDFAVAA